MIYNDHNFNQRHIATIMTVISQNLIPSLAHLDVSHVDTQKPPVVLVDGSYYLFRCYHGLPPLQNSQGLPTNAIRGVLTALNRLIQLHKPTYMAVAFDTKTPTFRHQLSKDYKANRKPMEDDLVKQIPFIHQLIKLLGIPIVVFEGYEADDIIGTLSYRACVLGHPVVISTGDKDMAQLVNDVVVLEDNFKGTVIDKDAVFAKFGVHATQIADYLTLMGDSVDGIAGIPKVGQKTAAKLLDEYNNIENIIAHVHDIKGSVGKSLIAHQHEIPLNRQLATIVTNLDLPIDFSALKMDICDVVSTKEQFARVQELHQLYQTLEFRTEIKQTVKLLENYTENNLTQNHTSQPVQNLFTTTKQNALSTLKVPSLPNSAPIYKTIDTRADFEQLMAKLSQAAYFAIDTETTSKHWQKSQLVGISISLANYEGFYIPVGHTADFDLLLEEQLPLQMVLSALKPILQNPNIGKIGQHLKYDSHIFKNYGIELNHWFFDTMLASYVINSTATYHNMDDLAKHYLNIQTTTFEDVAGKGVKQLTFDKIDIQTASKYACEDADITYRLFSIFDSYLQKDKNANELLQKIEIPVAKILTQMEENGVLIHGGFLNELSQKFDEEIFALEKKAIEIAGVDFNPASPKQLGEILFEKLGIKGGKKTKTGQYSTSESVLSKIDHPLVETILQYRELAKLKSTYTEALAKAADKQGRVHTNYHQALTSTGRLSSSEPNLQNIPIRTSTGRNIRKAFIAPKGRKILSADYSQIELRLMAHFSGDANLIDAFKQNLDIHQATAAEIMDKQLSDVSADERRAAKAINFGLLYGMGIFGLAKQLGVSNDEAKEYIKRYFSRYPEISQYMQKTKETAQNQGYVETILGRKLYTPNINADNFVAKEAAQRAAINAPLQGSAAEIIKLAMIAVDKVLPKDKALMLLQVHDELVFEVDESATDQIGQLIQNAMQNVLTDTAATLGWQVDFRVPLVVEIGVGDNWQEAH